jgi:hypothetical protein
MSAHFDDLSPRGVPSDGLTRSMATEMPRLSGCVFRRGRHSEALSRLPRNNGRVILTRTQVGWPGGIAPPGSHRSRRLR